MMRARTPTSTRTQRESDARTADESASLPFSRTRGL